MNTDLGRARLAPSSVAPKASIREVHKQTTRHRIIQAAQEVFDDQGYEVTTIDDIAVRALVGRSTLYSHFQGKNEIAIAIVEELTDKMHISTALLGQTIPGDRSSLASWLSNLEEQIRPRTVLNSSIFPSPAVDTAASVLRLDQTARRTIDEWAAAGWESAIENDVEHLKLLIILCIRWLILYPGLKVPEPVNSREVLIDIVSHEILRIVKKT